MFVGYRCDNFFGAVEAVKPQVASGWRADRLPYFDGFLDRSVLICSGRTSLTLGRAVTTCTVWAEGSEGRVVTSTGVPTQHWRRRAAGLIRF